MAVAAAIAGVGTEDNNMRPALPSMSQRLSNKMKMMQPPTGSALGEINRSIEKMSIASAGTVVGNFASTPQHCAGGTMTTAISTAANRRGSNWTNSTEGYGSMRSEQSMMSSRRCSDVSAMSQVCNITTLHYYSITTVIVCRAPTSRQEP